METGLQNSFIPHDATTPTERRRDSDTSLVGLLMLVAIVLMIASCVLYAGVYMYKQYLEKASQTKGAEITRANNDFSPSLVEQISRLDDRMQEADALLGAHIAPSIFFHMLEQKTLTTVSFRSLDLQSGGEDGMALKMDGVAESVNSIALQADLLSKVGIIKSPIFSDIDRQADGVHFTLAALVDPSTINYAQSQTAGRIDMSGAAPVPSPVPTAAQSPVSSTTTGFSPASPARSNQ